MKIIFICVNYNNSHHTQKLFGSLCAQNLSDGSVDIECIIVDNSSDPEDSERCRALFSDRVRTLYLRTTENIGYFGGLNYGLSHCHMGRVDYIVICNNDLVFESDFCQILAKKTYSAATLAVCPDVVTEDTFHQNPHVFVKRSWFRIFQFDLYFSNYYLALLMLAFLRIIRPIRTSRLQPQTGCEIHMGIGACYVLTSTFLNRFDRLAYKGFLYCEEVYFSDQIHSLNGILWFDPELKVHHAESASLSKLPKRNAYQIERDSYWGCRDILTRETRSVK